MPPVLVDVILALYGLCLVGLFLDTSRLHHRCATLERKVAHLQQQDESFLPRDVGD